MSKPDDVGTSQPRDKARQPGVNTANWEVPLPPQVRASKGSENVLPRSQGEVLLNDRQMEEMRRKIEEAKDKARASPSLDLPPRASGPARSAESSAAAAAKSTQSALNSVSPELLTELRKIIRDEVEQLNKGGVKEDVGEQTSRPSGMRGRPTSPVQSFSSIPGVNAPPASASTKDFEDRRNSPTAGGPSPTKGQQRDSPRPSTVRFSDETKPAVPITPRGEEGRKSSTSKDVELTTIDKKWGILFEKDGTHTKRMEHVVRGLANYIIEEFMPQRSIVITPGKMAAFYSHHRLEKEKFPFAALFNTKSKDFNETLASLYEDLGCQYFLVPADSRSRPSVPGLTPHGFMRWLITMIQAYPDEEAKRLDKVVSALPIEADSLLDGRPERLPKQISRHMLPKEALRKSKRLVDECMKEFQEDIEGSSTSRSKGSGGSNTGKPAPIIVTATSDKRSSVTTSSGPNPRYVPESAGKEARGDESGGSGHERDRRTTAAATSSKDVRDDNRNRRDSMAPPPVPNKPGRAGSVAENGRNNQSSREGYGSSTTGASGRVPAASSSSSSRKNRSPQRNPHSQSVPAGLDRDDLSGGRFRSASISTAAATMAANVLGTFAGAHSASQNLSSSTSALDTSARDARNSSDQHRDKRGSMDDSGPRMPASTYTLRDKADLESSSSTSRSSKRRSMVLPDTKGPTWDDYLKSSAPRSSTPSFAKKDGGNGSSS